MTTAVFIMQVIVVIFSLISSCACAMESYIIGGVYTSIRMFPHSVFLECRCFSGDSICGASILNQKILLTAAHCISDCTSKWSINAFAGHENVNKMPYTRAISKHIIHSEYNTKNFRNDIAVVYLKKIIPLGPTTKRVIIKKQPPYVYQVEVAGWGMVNDINKEQSLKLKAVKQTVQSQHFCDIATKNSGAFCAKNDMKNRPAAGDSGSALVTSSGQQLGLVSFRLEDVPELIIYTNVTLYYRWLVANANYLFCSGK